MLRSQGRDLASIFGDVSENFLRLSYFYLLMVLLPIPFNKLPYRKDFESGVRLGFGCFNLMVSILPAKIMNLLKLIGFRCDKEAGLAELKKVYEEKEGLRQFLASIVLLIYHLYLHFFIGSSGSSDMELCQDILQQKLKLYPEGAFFLCFQALYIY